MNQCPNCGESLSGDGYRWVVVCPNSNLDDWWDAAPDAGPFYCEFGDVEGSDHDAT